MTVELAKAWSRDPADAWVGETFLVSIVVLFAVVVGGWMFALSVENMVASVVSRQLLGIAVWLVAVAGFPVAAGLGCRLVHHRAHEPVAKRLYPLVASALVALWAVGLAGIWFAVFMVALATGHAVG